MGYFLIVARIMIFPGIIFRKMRAMWAFVVFNNKRHLVTGGSNTPAPTITLFSVGFVVLPGSHSGITYCVRNTSGRIVVSSVYLCIG